MGLNEYKPGTAFPGVIGRTTDQSSPAGRSRCGPGRRRRTCCSSCWTTPGTGSWAAMAARSPRRTSTRWPRAGCCTRNMHTTALCSPSRSCIITGRNHHANAMAAINELATGYPGYNGRIPFENGFLSEMLLAHGYSTYMVGKYHLLPSEFESAAGPFDRWPLGRGFERFYGFLGGDTSQWYPDLVYDNHQVAPPATPEQGYHLTGTWPTGDPVHRRRQAGRPGQAVLPALLHRRHARPAPRAQGVGRPVRRAVRRRLGCLPGAGSRPAEGARHDARDTELSRHDPDVPDWDSLPPDARRLAARMMEVFAGFLSHTDHHIGRLLDFLKETGEFDNTLIMLVSDNGASAEGGPSGHHQRAAVLQQRAGDRWRRAWPGSTSWAARHVRPLPVGLDLGGQHPVPPVEAGNLPRRHQRPVPGPLAGRDQGARRGAHPVRAHHRHGPDRAGRARPGAARGDPGRDPVAAPRRQLRPHLRRPGRAQPAPHPVLRDVRAPRHRP